MNKKTPKRSSSSGNTGYSPVTLHTSPATQSTHKNLTGPPRVIRDIIADLYNNIQRWNSLHIKGCAVVKQIASLKADQPCVYSSQLEEYMNQLYAIVLDLRANSEMFEVLDKQGEAFAKLPNMFGPVFFSLSADNISKLIGETCDAYKKEFQVKQIVLDNIAHARSKNDVMFLAAYWTHQLNVTDNITTGLESLLIESGHRIIQ